MTHKPGTKAPSTGIYWCSVCKTPAQFTKDQDLPECRNKCGRGPGNCEDRGGGGALGALDDATRRSRPAGRDARSCASQEPVAIGVGAGNAGHDPGNAGAAVAPWKPIWSWSDMTSRTTPTLPTGGKLIGELGALGRDPVHVRVHNLLTSGDGLRP